MPRLILFEQNIPSFGEVKEGYYGQVHGINAGLALFD
jgi:hypothetical protein